MSEELSPFQKLCDLIELLHQYVKELEDRVETLSELTLLRHQHHAEQIRTLQEQAR